MIHWIFIQVRGTIQRVHAKDFEGAHEADSPILNQTPLSKHR